MKAQLHCAKANLYVIKAKLICLNKFVTLTQSGFVTLHVTLIKQQFDTTNSYLCYNIFLIITS